MRGGGRGAGVGGGSQQIDGSDLCAPAPPHCSTSASIQAETHCSPSISEPRRNSSRRKYSLQQKAPSLWSAQGGAVGCLTEGLPSSNLTSTLLEV